MLSSLLLQPALAQGEAAHEKTEVSAIDSLTAVQLQRLAANARIYKEKVRPLQDALHVEKRRLAEILTNDDLSVSDAQRLQTKISTLKTEIRDLQLKKQLADSSVLTPTQRQAFRGHVPHQSAEQRKILALTGKTIQ